MPVLHRHGLVKGLRHGHAAVPGVAPNELWCADFKGEFKLGNGAYRFPRTVTDHASRYVLLCEALDSTREAMAITAFEQLFLERVRVWRSGVCRDAARSHRGEDPAQ